MAPSTETSKIQVIKDLSSNKMNPYLKKRNILVLITSWDNKHERARGF